MLDLEKISDRKDEDDKKDLNFGLRLDQYGKKTVNVCDHFLCF